MFPMKFAVLASPNIWVGCTQPDQVAQRDAVSHMHVQLVLAQIP